MNVRYQRSGLHYTTPPTGVPVEALPAGFYKAYTDPESAGFIRQYVSGDRLIPNALVEELLADFGSFLKTGPQYEAYGLSHRRGYLLHGPAGSGKSSMARIFAERATQSHDALAFVTANANEFTTTLYVRNTLEPERPAVVLMEDIEGWVDRAEVLNALDGVLSRPKTMFIAMTNYLDKLPARITNRPGRFDRVVEVPTLDRAVQLAFLRDIEARVPSGPKVAEDVVTALQGLPVTPAHLREAFAAVAILGTPLKTLTARFKAMFRANAD